MKRIAHSLVVLLALLVGSSAAQDGEWKDGAFVLGKKTPASNEAGLRFDWPVPSTFRVIHHQKKPKGEATIEHVMQLRRDRKTGDLILRCKSSRILDIDGRDFRRLEQSRTHGHKFAMPTLRISPHGAVIEPVGFARFAARNMRAVEKALEGRPGAQRRLAIAKKAMQSPQAMAFMKRAAVAFWRDWVETWAGIPVESGEQVEVGDEDKPCTITHHGPAKYEPGHVKLTCERVLRGKDVMKVLGRVAPQSKSPATRHENWKLVQRTEAITRADTLQPVIIRVKRVTTLVGAGGRTVTSTISHEYTFDWSGGTD